jgi:hypothetical protein
MFLNPHNKGPFGLTLTIKVHTRSFTASTPSKILTEYQTPHLLVFYTLNAFLDFTTAN